MSNTVVDPFGNRIEFRSIMRVGRARKDGKFPVSYVFASSGTRFNKIMTREQIEADIARDSYEVYGWSKTK